MIIAVDFDGTIVQHAYPKIGRERSNAIKVLKQLQNDGHQLILWTYRSGSYLVDALEFCEQRGLVFDAINSSYANEIYEEKISRKIYADFYIDDRAVGGLPKWNDIYIMISGKSIDAQSKTKGLYFIKRKVINLINSLFK